MFNYKALTTSQVEVKGQHFADRFGNDYIISDSERLAVLSDTICIGSKMSDKNGNEIFTNDYVTLINDAGQVANFICLFGVARREINNNWVDITSFYFQSENGEKRFPIAYNYLGKHDLELFEIIGSSIDSNFEKPFEIDNK